MSDLQLFDVLRKGVTDSHIQTLARSVLENGDGTDPAALDAIFDNAQFCRVAAYLLANASQIPCWQSIALLLLPPFSRDYTVLINLGVLLTRFDWRSEGGPRLARSSIPFLHDCLDQKAVVSETLADDILGLDKEFWQSLTISERTELYTRVKKVVDQIDEDLIRQDLLGRLDRLTKCAFDE